MVKPRRKISKQRAQKLSLERKKQREEEELNRENEISEQEEESDSDEYDCETSCINPQCHNFSIQALDSFSLPTNAVLVRTFFAKTAPISRGLFEGTITDKSGEPYGPVREYPVNQEYSLLSFGLIEELLKVAEENMLVVDGIRYTATVVPCQFNGRFFADSLDPKVYQTAPALPSPIDADMLYQEALSSFDVSMDAEKRARLEKIIG